MLLADEINRTSPKTQSSLLEVMEEGQVTVDSVTARLPQPFMVPMATQNPIDFVEHPIPCRRPDGPLFPADPHQLSSIEEEMDVLDRFSGNESPCKACSRSAGRRRSSPCRSW